MHNPSDKVSPMADYAVYAQQKGWAVDFACPPDQSAYFRAEFGTALKPGMKVAELGFGNGDFLAFARAAGAEVVGIEVQEALVAKARAAGIAAFPDLEALLPDHAGSFHLIVAFDVFEHLDHAAIHATLETTAALLAAGGLLILRAPNGQSPFGRRTQWGDCTHASVITPKKMEQMCYGKGLSVVKVANQARVATARSWRLRLLKRLQFRVRDACNAAIAAIYGMGTRVLDENIVIWVRKTG